MDQAHPTEALGRRRAILVATLLCILTALGGYLRLRDLGAPGLWFDEGITLEQGMRIDLVEAVGASTTHPPLARLLVRASVKLWGTSKPGGWDRAARLPSALLGTLGILMFFLCARRLASGDDLVGLFAATLWAVGPFGVYYSQEARYYAGLALFAAWVYHGAMLMTERPRSAWRGGYLLVGLLLGLYNHHLGVVPFLVSPLLLWPALRGWTRERRRLLALWPFVVAGLAFLPWLWFAFSNLEEQARPWIPGLSFQLPDVLAGWFAGRVGFYHVQRANWHQLLGLNVAYSAALLVGAGLIVHAAVRRGHAALFTVLGFLGPLAGAAVLHHLSASTRFFHHKYLAFLYPLVAVALAELAAFTLRGVTGLALWPALTAAIRRRDHRLWHRDWLLAGAWALGLASLFVLGRPALRGALEAHERHRWGSPTYLPREHYQEVSRWIESRRSPGAAVLVYDPHRRANNAWLLRYYGVRDPVVPISDYQARHPEQLAARVEKHLKGAKELFVVTAHASPEEHRLLLALVRAGSRATLGSWFREAAEGKTHAVHLGHFTGTLPAPMAPPCPPEETP